MCKWFGAVNITVPTSATAGYLVVRGRHTIDVMHTQGTNDEGFITWVLGTGSPATCNGTADKSYFNVASQLPSSDDTGLVAGTEYTQTVMTQSAFPIPAGGGTFTLNMNGKMDSSASNTNVNDRGDHVVVEFRQN